MVDRPFLSRRFIYCLDEFVNTRFDSSFLNLCSECSKYKLTMIVYFIVCYVAVMCITYECTEQQRGIILSSMVNNVNL